jgi:hypothetical protein
MLSLVLSAVTAFAPVPMPVEPVMAICEGRVPFVFGRSDNNVVSFVMGDKSQEKAEVVQDLEGVYLLISKTDGVLAFYNTTNGGGGKLKEEYKCYRLYFN